MKEATGVEDMNGQELNYGDEVSFVYNGSQDEYAGQEFIGTVVPTPQIDYQHGAVPLEGGWALNVLNRTQ